MRAPTIKQLASRQRRTLATMRKKVQEMAAQWEDLDQFCVNELTALADNIEVTANGLVDDGTSEASI